MEELKMLVQMVADLPNAALWVIAALFAYKVCIVGSIYGVIRLAIVKTHDWLITPRHELRKVSVEMEGMIRGMVITQHQEAFIAQLNVVHDNAVHSNQAVFSNDGAVHNCSMTNVRALLQYNCYSRKHVNGTAFLDITAIFNNDLTPIAPDSSTWSDINIPADSNITGNCSKRMNERRFVNYRYKALERIKHEWCIEMKIGC